MKTPLKRALVSRNQAGRDRQEGPEKAAGCGRKGFGKTGSTRMEKYNREPGKIAVNTHAVKEEKIYLFKIILKIQCI